MIQQAVEALDYAAGGYEAALNLLQAELDRRKRGNEALWNPPRAKPPLSSGERILEPEHAMPRGYREYSALRGF